MIACAYFYFYIEADYFCACRSAKYPVEMEPGGFKTMTVLFIMILPEKEMGLEKLVEHQCGIPGTGTKYFFIKEFEISF